MPFVSVMRRPGLWGATNSERAGGKNIRSLYKPYWKTVSRDMSSSQEQGMETTYCLHDQPTNQPTYVSLRINISPDQFPYLRDKVLHGLDYVGYPHRGRECNNAHYHIFIPTAESKLSERLRKRIKDNYPAGGNKFYSIKFLSNGILCGIQYGSKEGTTPEVSGESMLRLVSQAPPWEDRTGQKLLPTTTTEKKERDYVLTYTNLVCQAVQHARRNGLTGSLKETVQHMLEHSKWRPSKNMVCSGIPEFYIHDYEYRTGKRARQDMSWFTFRV